MSKNGGNGKHQNQGEVLRQDGFHKPFSGLDLSKIKTVSDTGKKEDPPPMAVKEIYRETGISERMFLRRKPS